MTTPSPNDWASNRAEFEKLLPHLLKDPENHNQVALMKNSEIVGIFPNLTAASFFAMQKKLGVFETDWTICKIEPASK